MENKSFTVLDLIGLDLKEQNSLNLHCIAGRKGLGKEIKTQDINRPMGGLMGFFEYFAGERIQLFGRGENAYLKAAENRREAGALASNLEDLFALPVPCCVFTHNFTPSELFLKAAEKAECPVLQTDLSSMEFTSRLIRILSEVFSPSQSLHGVLVEVYGLGILILGDSGIGKSEAALELVMSGHRLVADDVVEIHCVNGNMLIGTGANKIIGHHMEIRGLGIINITHLFGVRAIRERKEIQLVITLDIWDSRKNYNRLGTDEKTMDILGVSLPHLDVPVKPGRNIKVIIETAAMNERLKSMGYNAAKEFNKNILKWLESEAVRPAFFGYDGII